MHSWAAAGQAQIAQGTIQWGIHDNQYNPKSTDR